MGKFSISNFIPIINWLPAFFKNKPGQYISGDIVAGLTVKIMFIFYIIYI